MRNPAHAMGAAVLRRCAAACPLAALSQSPCATPTPTHHRTRLLQLVIYRLRTEMDPAARASSSADMWCRTLVSSRTTLPGPWHTLGSAE